MSDPIGDLVGQKVDEALREMDPTLEFDSHSGRSARVFLGVMFTGTRNTELLSTRLLIPERDVRAVIARCEENGLITEEDGRVAIDPADNWPAGGDGSGTAFWLDVGVAAGSMRRRKQDGKYMFSITQQGEDEVEVMGISAAIGRGDLPK